MNSYYMLNRKEKKQVTCDVVQERRSFCDGALVHNQLPRVVVLRVLLLFFGVHQPRSAFAVTGSRSPSLLRETKFKKIICSCLIFATKMMKCSIIEFTDRGE